MISLSEYMSYKAVNGYKSLTVREAEAFCIPYPPLQGWLREFATLCVNEEELLNLLEDAKRKGDEAAWKTIRAVESSLGLDHCEKVIKQPVLIVRTPKQEFKLLKRKQRKVRLKARKLRKVDEKKLKKVRQPSVSSISHVIQKCTIDVTSDAFLQSFEWRALRMQALKLHGTKCQCCGATPSTGAVMNVDHVKPRKFYPELALVLENLQILCGDCNHGKGNWDETDWRIINK